MKYKIWWQGYRWVLSYEVFDEGGPGWYSCMQSSFKWTLRLYAPIHNFFYKRDVEKHGYDERFEI